MEISLSKSGLRRADAGQAALGQPVVRFLCHRILYLAMLTMAAGALLVTTTASYAQEPQPQIIPGERKAKTKKDTGPRAVALLRMNDDKKATLLPLAILVNGKFYDATAYKADPVPMALESGTVYEGERTGNSLGLFTVGSALHANAPNADTPWLGTGAWLPAGSEAESKIKKSESAPKGIQTVEEPPRLTRGDNSSGTPASKPSGNAPGSSSPPSDSSKPSSAPSGDEPPRLNRPASSQAPDSSSGSQGSAQTQQPSSAPPDDSDRPRLNRPSSPSSDSGSSQNPPQSNSPQNKDSKDSKSADSKQGDSKGASARIPDSDSGAPEANRPILRRGKPAESFADEDVPGYSKPGAHPAPGSGPIVATNAQASPTQFVPAISDAHGPEPHSYTYEWVKGDDDLRRQQLTDMAKEQLRVYVTAHHAVQSEPKPAAQRTTRATRPVKKPVIEPIFGNVQMIPYDLWVSNQPVIVFSADAHLPPPPAGTPQSGTQADLQYSILLVAYPDIYNNLHKIYAGVTDKYHLDITPRLELIDAVDADGDGRGELIFRETSDAGTGWVIYRATADKLWKMFDTLNPE
jgi:hypothetical protein